MVEPDAWRPWAGLDSVLTDTAATGIWARGPDRAPIDFEQSFRLILSPVIVESAWPQLPFNRKRDMTGARLPDVLWLTAADFEPQYGVEPVDRCNDGYRFPARARTDGARKQQAHDTLDNLPNLNRRELSMPNDRSAQASSCQLFGGGRNFSARNTLRQCAHSPQQRVP
jgi:hypothetical protein